MKTQLLEDIGQSGTASLVPSGKISSLIPGKAVHAVPPAKHASAPIPRSAAGVWRRKPVAELTDFPPVRPSPQSPLPEIASGSAAPMPPAQVQAQAHPETPQPVPDAAAPAGEIAVESPIPRAEPVSPDPLFDFAPRPSATPEPASTNQPGWYQRSGQRYLLWGACLVSAALLAKGALWLHDARKDSGSLALVANEYKAEPQRDKAVKRRALAAKEFMLGADGEVRLAQAPAAPSAPQLPRPASTVPPLVLLEPEPANGSKPEPAAPSPLPPAELQETRKAAPKAEREHVTSQKRTRRLEREQMGTVDKPTRTKVEQSADSQSSRSAVTPVAGTPVQGSTTAATLKACREHGYHAAQCVRRACSVTKYGFVCRGK